LIFFSIIIKFYWKKSNCKETRDNLSYQIDGLVLRINDIDFQATLNDGNLRPKFAIAYKFENIAKPTIVRDVVWQCGNSGRITPVAIFDPIELLGSTVERASVHNVSCIERTGISIGAEVLVCKNNEIIPQIQQVIKQGTKPVITPQHCPECKQSLIMDGEYLICSNIEFCPAQKSGRLRNWIKANNILSWGVVVLDNLVESCKVNDIADLYDLSVDDLLSLERIGEKSAKKLYDILHSSKEMKLENFIDGLTIQGIGSTVVGNVMDAGYDTLDKMMEAKLHHFENIPGIGSIKGKALYEGLQKNKVLIDRLLKAGIIIKQRTQGKFKGMSFCFTGDMQHSREELIQFVIDNGGIVKNSAVKTLTYLIYSDTSTTKYKAAKNNKNCTLLTEKEFLELIE
jgi:DNA ligase (NAD+)